MSRESKVHLKSELNVSIYRQTAIAMSKKHLPDAKFNRDDRMEDDVLDKQSSHSSWQAGTTYARLMQEAPGHVQVCRAKYRHVSREWHMFLGFRSHPGSSSERKRPAPTFTAFSVNKKRAIFPLSERSVNHSANPPSPSAK